MSFFAHSSVDLACDLACGGVVAHACAGVCSFLAAGGRQEVLFSLEERDAIFAAGGSRPCCVTLSMHVPLGSFCLHLHPALFPITPDTNIP